MNGEVATPKQNTYISIIDRCDKLIDEISYKTRFITSNLPKEEKNKLDGRSELENRLVFLLESLEDLSKSLQV